MNMYKGPMNKAKGRKDGGWKVGVGEAGECGGGKMEATVFKQQ